MATILTIFLLQVLDIISERGSDKYLLNICWIIQLSLTKLKTQSRPQFQNNWRCFFVFLTIQSESVYWNSSMLSWCVAFWLAQLYFILWWFQVWEWVLLSLRISLFVPFEGAAAFRTFTFNISSSCMIYPTFAFTHLTLLCSVQLRWNLKAQTQNFFQNIYISYHGRFVKEISFIIQQEPKYVNPVESQFKSDPPNQDCFPLNPISLLDEQANSKERETEVSW